MTQPPKGSRLSGHFPSRYTKERNHLMTQKFDITSTVLEKSIDIAKQFLDKLVSPAIEEAGLLVRDSVALWKFKNQVRILNKAKECCEKNSISPKVISLKLLCPLLDGAALEEDETLQDKWATLLSNMIDSEQNIQNHVFPYILGQLSINEFSFLERVLQDKKDRIKKLTEELEEFRSEKPALELGLAATSNDLSKQIEEEISKGKNRYSTEVWELDRKRRAADTELKMLNYRENSIISKIKQPETLPDEGLREFEVSNVIRLGLVKHVQETYANSSTLEIPNNHDKEYLTVDVDIEVESNNSHLLTELGELFIEACTEKIKV